MHAVCLFSYLGDVNSFAGSVRQNLQQFDRKQLTPMELGDIIHVRGRVKCFRGNREVSASYYSEYIIVCSHDIK